LLFASLFNFWDILFPLFFEISASQAPNPAQSVINVNTVDGSKLAGNLNNAVITIYNYNMRVQKIIPVLPAAGNAIIPVTNLTQGIYRIQLTRGNEVLGCSFIKE